MSPSEAAAAAPDLDPRPDDGPIDIVARLERRRERGHEAERRLIDVMLGDLSFAASASISEIAARAGVSEPTLTRLSRALGFAGTKSLRFHLAQALAVGGAHLAGGRLAEGPDPAAERIVSRVCRGAHAALELMAMALVEFDMAAFTAPLTQADQVLVYGTGGTSSMAATETQNRLFRLGLHVTAHTDPQLQRMSASVASGRTVVIAYSLSGRVRSVIDAVAIAAQYGATTLAVTPADSPLSRLADATLPLTFREDGDLYKPSPARYALLAAVDSIATGTAEAIGPGVVETTRRVRQSLAGQNLGDPTLPIGD